LSPKQVPAKVRNPPDAAARPDRHERRVCPASRPFAGPWRHRRSRPESALHDRASGGSGWSRSGRSRGTSAPSSTTERRQWEAVFGCLRRDADPRLLQHRGGSAGGAIIILLPLARRSTQVQCRLAKLHVSERAPTIMRLTAQVASRLNQLRDTKVRPR
jgi:hypothetical protein